MVELLPEAATSRRLWLSTERRARLPPDPMNGMDARRARFMALRSVEEVTESQPFRPSSSTLSEDMSQERFIHAEHVLAVRRNLLTTDKATRVASLFAVLGDPTRLQVVYALLSAPTGELCVFDLATALGRDDTTISHQLRVLRNLQIVAMRKVGRVVYYRLIDDHIRLLLELGLTHASELSVPSQKDETETLA